MQAIRIRRFWLLALRDCILPVPTITQNKRISVEFTGYQINNVSINMYSYSRIWHLYRRYLLLCIFERALFFCGCFLKQAHYYNIVLITIKILIIIMFNIQYNN